MYLDALLTLSHSYRLRTLSMTFGRPPAIPNEFVNVDLPINIDLDKLSGLSFMTSAVVENNTSTVSFFIATMYHQP